MTGMLCEGVAMLLPLIWRSLWKVDVDSLVCQWVCVSKRLLKSHDLWM